MESNTIVIIILGIALLLFALLKLEEDNIRAKEDEKINLQDRFFLEEIVKRLKNNHMEYVETLLHDWMKEKVENYPLSEEQREDYLREVLGYDDDFTSDGWFASELDLKEHIGL
ncbi:MAG: hypothetical protein AB3N18_13095 [Allomuricauda sp.]